MSQEKALAFDVLRAAEDWFIENREALVAQGFEVHWSRTTDNRPKHSCVIGLRKGGVESEIVLWNSGEAELWRRDDTGVLLEDQKERVLSVPDFHQVLDKLLKQVGSHD